MPTIWERYVTKKPCSCRRSEAGAECGRCSMSDHGGADLLGDDLSFVAKMIAPKLRMAMSWPNNWGQGKRGSTGFDVALHAPANPRLPLPSASSLALRAGSGGLRHPHPIVGILDSIAQGPAPVEGRGGGTPSPVRTAGERWPEFPLHTEANQRGNLRAIYRILGSPMALLTNGRRSLRFRTAASAASFPVSNAMGTPEGL